MYFRVHSCMSVYMQTDMQIPKCGFVTYGYTSSYILICTSSKIGIGLVPDQPTQFG